MKKLFLLLLIVALEFSGCKTHSQVGFPVIIINGLTSGILNTNYTFTSTVTGGLTPYSYSWYGGGTPSTGTDSTFTTHWTSTSSYTVSLTVTDSLSHASTASLIITINPIVNSIPIRVDISGPTSGITNTNYTYHISWSGGTPPYTYIWSSGGSLSGGGNPNTSTSGYFTIQWSKAGTYTISVTVRDSLSRTGTTSLGVTISSTPANNIIPSENQNMFPITQTFTDEYSDMYVITVEKFEKNLKFSITNDQYTQSPLKAGELFIGVLVKVKNDGKHSKLFMQSDFSMKDYTGYGYYGGSPGIFVNIPNHKVFEYANLVSNETYEGWLFYIVPKTILDGPFTFIYNTGEFDENFNYKTLQFTLR